MGGSSSETFSDLVGYVVAGKAAPAKVAVCQAVVEHHFLPFLIICRVALNVFEMVPVLPGKFSDLVPHGPFTLT